MAALKVSYDSIYKSPQNLERILREQASRDREAGRDPNAESFQGFVRKAFVAEGLQYLRDGAQEGETRVHEPRGHVRPPWRHRCVAGGGEGRG